MPHKTRRGTPSKRSEAELKRLVQTAIDETCGLPRKGLWLCVDAVESSGHPPERLRVWSTLHFLREGSPFCCGEPGCHLYAFTNRLAEISEHVRQAMGLRQPVEVEFRGRIAGNYHEGVEFHYGEGQDGR
jgi:hypothetical protein